MTTMRLNDIVLQIIAADPGIGSTSIAAHVAAMDPCPSKSASPDRSVSSALNCVWRQGKVQRVKQGREFCYWPGCSKSGVTVKPENRELRSGPEISGPEIEALQKRLAELEAWREEAIAKHPELAPVDPVLIEAREIGAEICRNNGSTRMATEVLAGDHDEGLAMRAIAEAIRRYKP